MALVNPVPSGTLTDGYGPRGSVPGLGDLGFHTGRDIAAPGGTPILSAHDGVVTRKWFDRFANGAGAGGWMLESRGDDGVVIRYAHMQAESPLSPGERVIAGRTVIGSVGMSGAATGNHLHLEVLVNGQFVNPDPYLTGSPTDEGEEDMRGIIYRSTEHGKHGVYAGPTGGFVILQNAEEAANLKAIGTPEVWLTPKTLQELITDARKMQR